MCPSFHLHLCHTLFLLHVALPQTGAPQLFLGALHVAAGDTFFNSQAHLVPTQTGLVVGTRNIKY